MIQNGLVIGISYTAMESEYIVYPLFSNPKENFLIKWIFLTP